MPLLAYPLIPAASAFSGLPVSERLTHMATKIMACDMSTRRSSSRTSRRQQIIQPKGRSTTRRRGSIRQPQPEPTR